MKRKIKQNLKRGMLLLLTFAMVSSLMIGIAPLSIARADETSNIVLADNSKEVQATTNTLNTISQIPEGTVRVHYVRDKADYDNWSLWIWEDVVTPSSTWPKGMAATGIDEYGSYFDVLLKENAKKLGALLVNSETSAKDCDTNRGFALLDTYNEVWIKEGDDKVYISAKYEMPVLMVSANILSESKMKLTFTNTGGLDKDILKNEIIAKDSDGVVVSISNVNIVGDQAVEIDMAIDTKKAPYTITYKGKVVEAKSDWRFLDNKYYYDGTLGATLKSDGTALLKFWSPMVKDVKVILYDKNNQEVVIKDKIQMVMGTNGVWTLTLNKENTGLDSLKGYYYHYLIDEKGDGKTKLGLDPYAKSMAAFSNTKYEDASLNIGKAAIVDPSTIGPVLDYADIDGFEKREDAIIWEAQVRDFTSDPSISSDLNARFGTFKSFIDKLDYVKSLGVTHIQLLPIMSYLMGDDLNNNEREMKWSSDGNNYNWGYDPQSYFAVSGMYSENPNDPELRIKELKMLINEIHSRGMGVTLDVVYNHTADVRVFEDLVPGYYHFMNADGSPKTSFGGGRLGTTHAMSRKVLLDSILYWTEEFKVDGFRFDMMGDQDAESIQIACDKAKELNPNILMIGEGWITYSGDEGDVRQAADQNWMKSTDSVSVFSDEIRNELKSGYGIEGKPRFLTGGAREISQIFENIKAQPRNFVADDPGDVVQYIEAHDNLPLHDVIAQSIKKDPEFNEEEIHKRIRIGNAMMLTSQGVAFIHAGQEYGRSKQWKDPNVENIPTNKFTYMEDKDGKPFVYPYFISDSNDSSDTVNMFDWTKATDAKKYPINNLTREYTSGLMALRRSTNAFRLGSKDIVDANVIQIKAAEIQESDLVLAYTSQSTDNTGLYYVFVNADDKERKLTLDTDLTKGSVLVDNDEAGIVEVTNKSGFKVEKESITIDPLTTVVIRASGNIIPDKDGSKEVVIDKITPDDVNIINIINEGKEVVVSLKDIAAIKSGNGSVLINLSNGTKINIPFSLIDKALLEGATNVKVKFNTIDNSDIVKGLKAVNKVFDFSLQIEYGDTVKLIHDFANGGVAEVTLTLTDEDLEGLDRDKIKVLYYNEVTKKYEVMETKVTGNNIIFKTPHFSKFIVAEVNDNGEPVQASKTSSTDTIKTGDNNSNRNMLILGAFSLISLAVVVTIGYTNLKKKKSKS